MNELVVDFKYGGKPQVQRDFKMENNYPDVYLRSLAVIHEKIAKLVFISTPFPEWTTAVFSIQSNPQGDALASQYIYFLKDGTEIRRKRPEDDFDNQIHAERREHVRLTRAANQLWFRMTFVVENTGQWKVDFVYRDRYEEGDLGIWDWPEFEAVMSERHAFPSQLVDLKNEFLQQSICDPFEYLQQLAKIHDEIANLVSVSVPYERWLEAVFVVQANPRGDTFCSQFIYFQQDGVEVRGKFPDPIFNIRINAEIAKHLRLTREANQPWFRLTFVVRAISKWKIDLKYRDQFESGDERKWDLPDFGKGEI